MHTITQQPEELLLDPAASIPQASVQELLLRLTLPADRAEFVDKLRVGGLDAAHRRHHREH